MSECTEQKGNSIKQLKKLLKGHECCRSYGNLFSALLQTCLVGKLLLDTRGHLFAKKKEKTDKNRNMY